MLRFIKPVVYGAAVGVTCIDLIGYVAKVEGESMKPTLNPFPFPNERDYVFLNKFIARDYQVKRGEIICLISPKDPSQRIIKRVIANEGDIISTVGYKEKVVKIPQGHIWVEGDHVQNSLDSNTFGTIPVGLMTAKATYIVWPPSRWRRLSTDPVRQPIKIAKNESFNNS